MMNGFYIFHSELTESGLSSRAKSLFALLYSRRSLSLKNGIYAASGKPCVFCSTSSAAAMLGCSNKTAVAVLRELVVAGYVSALGKSGYLIREMHGHFVAVPAVALSLSSDAAVLYACIGAKILSGFSENCAFSIGEITARLKCGNKKASTLLASLRDAGLIHIARTVCGNIISLAGDAAKMTHRVISAKIASGKATIKKIIEKEAKMTHGETTGFSRREGPKMPEKSRSVIFTDKIYNNNYIYNYISSSDDEKALFNFFGVNSDCRSFCVPLCELFGAIKRSITKKKAMRLGGALRSWEEISALCHKLTTENIAAVCRRISRVTGIVCLKSYLAACLCNAPQAICAENKMRSASKSESSLDISEYEKLAIGGAASIPEHSFDINDFEKLAIGYRS